MSRPASASHLTRSLFANPECRDNLDTLDLPSLQDLFRIKVLRLERKISDAGLRFFVQDDAGIVFAAPVPSDRAHLISHLRLALHGAGAA